MSDFKAKMHQIRFRLGFHPTPRLGSLQRFSDFLAGFEGATTKGEGKEGERKQGRQGRAGTSRKGKEREGKGKGIGMGREKRREGEERG